jgi:hypothetical protein
MASPLQYQLPRFDRKKSILPETYVYYVVSLTQGTVYEISRISVGGGRKFNLNLTGAAEAPDPGDPDGSGTARLTVSLDQKLICYELAVEAIALPGTGAHIHKAPAGSPGPVVVPLTPPDASGFSQGCVAVERNLIKDILAHPREYYVNVHNAEFQPGALRAQLKK